jgi:hypothetical protein
MLPQGEKENGEKPDNRKSSQGAGGAHQQADGKQSRARNSDTVLRPLPWVWGRKPDGRKRSSAPHSISVFFTLAPIAFPRTSAANTSAASNSLTCVSLSRPFHQLVRLSIRACLFYGWKKLPDFPEFACS